VHHVDERPDLGTRARDGLEVGQDPLDIDLCRQVAAGEVEAARAVAAHGRLFGRAPADALVLASVQRALRGSAKRIWVQLESHGGWETHRLARPETEPELAAAVRVLTDSPGLGVVEPAPDEVSVEVQTVVLALTADVYEAFGLTHANRKRDLEAACASVLATDRTYLRAEIRPAPLSKRRFELHVARATGALRTERHRLALRDRARHSEDGAKEAA
jgi:hypothetical protein